MKWAQSINGHFNLVKFSDIKNWPNIWHNCLKILPTHLEIKYLPHSDDSYYNLEDISAACTEVCKAIKAGIKKVTADINYIHNVDQNFTYLLYTVKLIKECAEDRKHPARLKRSAATNEIKMLICSKDDQRSCSLPEHWLRGIDAHAEASDMQCNSSHHAVLLTQLSEHAAKWRDIGTSLGFHKGELDITLNMHLAISWKHHGKNEWVMATEKVNNCSYRVWQWQNCLGGWISKFPGYRYRYNIMQEHLLSYLRSLAKVCLSILALQAMTTFTTFRRVRVRIRVRVWVRVRIRVRPCPVS